MPTKMNGNSDKSFLLGPRSRWKEFKYAWKTLWQFVKGFRALHFAGPCVTVFGSARFKGDHPYYQMTVDLGKAISEMGFAVMTGGGPGLMEAANNGAREAGGLSLGCNIVLGTEQRPNPYLDKFVTMEQFFVRKELLRKYSFAFVIMPGGFGTLDEFFETLTLVQTKKMERMPLIIMGKEYHKSILDHIELMAEEGTIHPEDRELILFTDSISEVVEHIQKFAAQKASLKLQAAQKPIWFLGEKR